MGRFTSAAMILACTLVLIPGAAYAAQTSQPLAGGSSFQGADGNQDNESPFTDWQTYADTPPGTNTAVTKLDSPVGTGDAAGPDYFYAGKEDTPDEWTLESDSGGIEPGKSNALAASSVRDPLQSKTFFYFAFVREIDSNADTFYGVELNQRTNTWINSKGTSIPCRSTGDLMISYHVDASAKNVEVSAHRWQGVDQSATHPECPTGGTGTFTSVTLGINAQGHMNFESLIANYIRRDVLGNTLTAGRFGEGAINLSDTIGVGSNPCFSFGQVQLHSRSSGAFDSALQDTVDPAPLAVRNCSLSGSKFRDDNGDGSRQANEPGLQGWTFWVDYDDDGTIGSNEPSGVSDASGAYTISNINPAAQGQGANQGPFRILEQAPAGVTGYSCTYPNAGTTGGGVDAHGCFYSATFSSTGNQSGFDFLNKPPGRIVVKKVNTGGTQSDVFGFSTTGLGADFTLAASNAAGQVFDVGAGSYSVTEKSAGQPAGYRLTDIDCDDTDSTQALNVDRRATIVLSPGETVTCTFTNTKDASLRVVKSVVNDDGGTAGASAFSLHVKQGGTDVGGSPAAGSATGTVYSLAPGSYGVSEATPPAGYLQSPGVTGDCALDGAITLAAGESKTCTITNDDVAPRLKVIKTVTNDDGGTKVAGDFTMNVTGTDVSDPSFAGVAGPIGETVTLDAGSYGVDEGAHDGYAKALSADCAGTIAIGESKTCTITNDDIAAKLVVVKHVENRGGSTGTASDFQIAVDDAGATNPPSFAGAESPGTDVAVDPGAYSVDEVEDPAYAKTLSADCSGSIAIGQTKTCTITNTRRTGTLEVVKRLRPANDTGRFDLQIDGATKSGPNGVGDTGTTGVTTVATGTHTIGEIGHTGTDLANYQTSASCADGQGAAVTLGAGNAVTVGASDAIVCTITNTRKTNPAIAVDKKERRGSTGTFTDGPIDVHVGDTIQYEIDVTNPGDTPLTVSFADPNCDPGTLTGPTGDANSNGLLDPGETLTWRCSHLVEDADGSQVVNVAKATGVDPLDKVVNGEDRVVADVLDPSVVVDKAGPQIAYHGDTVTYEFTVSNTGNTPLHGVNVTDDRCSNVSAAPVRRVNDDGDALLEKIGADGINPEQWIFSCSRTIGDHAGGEENPIVNTATVSAVDGLDRTVTSTDRHTTRIIHPAVSVDKTGPATAKAGDLVTYTIAVGNTGDVAFPDPLVVVGDALCEAPPQLASRNGDPSPATLDPGETWTYTCSVQTEAGQDGVDNVATVAATDVNGRHATGSDGAATVLARPAPEIRPVAVQPQVEGASVQSGRAKLRGPTGCPSSRRATKAVVTGRQIKSVVFYVDGRRVRKVTSSQALRRWSITLRPGTMRFGTHRVRARVVFKAASGTKPKILALAFNRCRPRVAPTFTG